MPPMVRGAAKILQLNIGLYCNQACSHCHVESSPLRQEQRYLPLVHTDWVYMGLVLILILCVLGPGILIEMISSMTCMRLFPNTMKLLKSLYVIFQIK